MFTLSLNRTKNIMYTTRRTTKTATFFLASAIILLVTATTPVMAQSSDVQALLDRMNRLESDLNSVQRKVFQGQTVPAPNLSGGATSAPVGGSEGAAILSGRIDTLEQEQRRVTGSTEEVNFKLDQLKSRLDKLVLDVDYRLTEIERRLGGGSGAVVGQNSGSAIQSNAANAGALPPLGTNQQVATGGELPQGTKSLGTIRANEDGSVAENNGAATSDVVANLAPEEQYNLAMSLIRKDDYVGAEQAFSQFLDQNRQHGLAGNAQYWLGETFYVRGDYNNAASAFLNGYQNYPDSSKGADNLLKLGMTLGRMDQIEEACTTFLQLEKQFKILPSRLKQISAREKQKFNCP